VVSGNIYPAGDLDYFSFSGSAGDRVYATTITSFAAGSADSILTLFDTDGTTVSVAGPGNVVTICSTPNVPIPDPGQVTDTISVAADLTILDFNVYINALHTWVGDLSFALTHVDSGTTMTLIDQPGVPASTFGCSGDNYAVWVDDEGIDTPIENQCSATPPAITGRAIGGDPPNALLLTAFDGLSTLGEWTLTAIDNASAFSGTLAEWCVEVTFEEPPAAFACNAPAEDFEDGVPPAGWLVQTNEPSGPQWTTIAGCGEAGNFTNGTGEAACVSSDIFGAAEMDTSLVTPMFSLAGFGAASLSYTANYQNFANLDFLDVDISADGGATWATLLSWNEDHGAFRAQPGEDVTIDLSAYAGQSGLMLRYRYYDPNTGDWNWYAQVDNVALSCGTVEEPNIDVDPLSMSSTQPANTTTQQTLDVGNTGTADLTWMIEEEPAAAPAPFVISASKLGAPAAAQRSAKELQDLADSRMADVVQDGGFEAGTPNPFWTEASTNFGTPLCTIAGCGTGTSTGPRTGNWWAWFGGITAYEAGSVSQSVTIPSGGPATLSFWVEQFVCSGSALDYLEVNMDGTQLWMTTATDPACGTLGYRQVTLDVSAYADGGAHTLQFNSEVFGSGNTNFFVDDVVLDAQTEPGVCDMPADLPWLSVNPTNGTTAPAATTPVQVTLDSTGLAAGVYNANLCISSNDPDPGPGNGTNLVIVPVELTVVEAEPAIEIVKTVGTTPGVCAATSTITVPAGATVYYCYTVTNTGNVTLNLHDLTDDQLGAIFSGLNYALDPGASVNTMAAGLSIPVVINQPTTNTATWTAYNAGPSNVAIATATATVNVTYGLYLPIIVK